jgi:RNA polymerase sigma factor (sigma-70 family)
MTRRQLSPVLRHLRRLVGPPAQDGVSDAQLLDRFVAQNDEAAFELLLWRHGPMVWGLCRRILPNFHEAEDVFQAAMLVLARKAGSINKKRSLASWLYKVAFRIALRARADSSRRFRFEKQLERWPARVVNFDSDNGCTELRPLIDEGLDELPEKYRAPVVLCYLQNKTNEEAARLLRWPIGTVKTRLAKARELLGRWLRRRGVVLSAAGLASALIPSTSQAMMPAGLLSATLKSAMLVSAGSFGAAAISVRTLLLMEGTMKAMFWTKMKIVTAVVLFAGVAGSGAGMISYRTWAADQPGDETPIAQKPGSTDPRPQTPILPPPPELPAAQAERDKAASDLKAAEASLQAAKFYLSVAQKKVDAIKVKTQADQPPDPKQPVAFIFDMPITREQLADYLIAQYGADKLEQLVNKLIIERSCRDKGITVSDAEIDEAVKEDMNAMACSDPNAFEDHLKSKFNRSLREWKEDVVKPRVCLGKLARLRVSASEEDIRKAFEGAFGEKAQCEIILWPKGQEEAAKTAYAIIRDHPEEFKLFGRQKVNISFAARLGRIDPFSRHTTAE